MAQITRSQVVSPQVHYPVGGAGPRVTLVHGVGADLHSWA
jgi:hypothetical protein